MAASTLTAEEYIATMQPTLFDTDDQRDVYINLSRDMTSASYFGSMFEYAVALRSMHNRAIDKDRPDGAAGLITGKSEGNAAIRYYNKVEKGIYTDLHMTHWGQRLKALMKSKGAAISVAADAENLLTRLVDI